MSNVDHQDIRIGTMVKDNAHLFGTDFEGWHDPVYRGDLEMTGQVHGLNYLKECRGGPFVTNPTAG